MEILLPSGLYLAIWSVFSKDGSYIVNYDSDGFRVLVPLIIGTQVLLDPCTFETAVADQKRKKKLLLLKELIASAVYNTYK